MYKSLTSISLTAILALGLTACAKPNENQKAQNPTNATNTQNITLLNVSYDVARDFYKDFNPLFIKNFTTQHPDKKIDIQQSHGGSSKQALSVANGLQADVVSMNQGSDIELLVKKRVGC